MKSKRIKRIEIKEDLLTCGDGGGAGDLVVLIKEDEMDELEELGALGNGNGNGNGSAQEAATSNGSPARNGAEGSNGAVVEGSNGGSVEGRNGGGVEGRNGGGMAEGGTLPNEADG